MKRILFVDDEIQILQGLRRLLHKARAEYQMAFADSGEKALAMMQDQSFDIIVSDMRMPKMDGAKLLSEVKKRHPGTIRIALSGYSDGELILESLQATHQFLSKPIEYPVLKSTLDRALNLNTLLNNQAVQTLATQIQTPPSLPSIYADITRELASDNGSMARVAEIICADISMSAKILQLANSAFFGLAKQVDSITEAVNFLGSDTIRSLVLTIKVFQALEDSTRPQHFQALWSHSQAVGSLARSIAKDLQLDAGMVNSAFSGGLLHDIGDLLLSRYFSEDYQAVDELMAEQGIGRSQAEQQVFGCDHGAVGSYLLNLWGISYTISACAAFHNRHRALNFNILSPVEIVYIANKIVESIECDSDPGDHLCNDCELDRQQLEHWLAMAKPG